MSKHLVCLDKQRGLQPVLEMELPDMNAVEAKSRELAQVLREETRKTQRSIDTDMLRVSDDKGGMILAAPLGQLARPIKLTGAELAT